MSSFDNDIDISQVAHECIDAGNLSGGYTLVLLQQIRDDLRKLISSLKEGKGPVEGEAEVED